MWPLLLSQLSLADDCLVDADWSTIQVLLERGEAAYTQTPRDAPTIQRAQEGLWIEFQCLKTALTPEQIARIHRLSGLALFVSDSREQAPTAFAAARRIEPDHPFEQQLSGGVALAYRAIDDLTPQTTPIPATRDGHLLLDGVETLERPDMWPTVLQRIHSDGSVDFTLYLKPDDPLPDYPQPIPVATLPSEAVSSLPPETATGARWLWLGAGGSLLASGAMVAAGQVARARFWTPDTTVTDDELMALYRQHRLWSAVGIGLGAGSVGLSVTAIRSQQP